ncbi:ROK family protein [Metabacillus sp. GX 13764]|uniref:ROK family protein n=1 Tax=Metabacillus kandeliae TaxID=2900151 RepID=UPI001E2E0E3E|nr:ROK family protein [Metabacillus kandeliae]MCD7032979.1 ROK family protein [Metabacillus kandeliae]
MNLALGLDIGGTKIASGLVDESGACLGKLTVKSDPSSPEAMYALVREAAEKAILHAPAGAHIIGAGAGVPGKLDLEKGLAVFQNNLPWRHFPLKERLEQDLKLPVTMDNDVYMAAFAEHHARRIDNKKTFVYMTVSTGISCCILYKGEFFRGAGFAGEIGLSISGKSPQGLYQTLEEAASGKVFAPYVLSNQEKGEVIDSLLAGEEPAASLAKSTISHLAQSIYSLGCVLDPHLLILGGGVIMENSRLLAYLAQEIKSYQTPVSEEIAGKLGIALLGKEAGLCGAGLMCHSKLKGDAVRQGL